MDLLKDARKKEWFWLENDLVDREDLGIYEKMIYIVLARYSDNESCCFPSYKTIALKCGCSERQAKSVVKILENKGLIKKENRIKSNSNEKESNIYFVLTAKLGGEYDAQQVVNMMHNPSAPHAQQVVNMMHSKKTNIKKTYIKSNTTPQNEPKTDYLDLSFLDLDIEKVKLTKDEYDKLISKFGKKYIHDKIVSLENYIVNGKGSRYKSHYRALLTWGNADTSKGILQPVTKAKNPLSGFKEL
ncbi:phage replication initiation protein [Clostridioides difficile]|uniref:Phage replication initiation protein n=1 Tax=Clostridioides difficile ATCC 9689 = DSM 1296 TaxID=1121308 RepID=A0AC59G4P2_CLODI|nr:helix-turn-helix domain-containing protein [Clostridioides difficile]AKP44644.1 phage replication initiation protein [Clostridioides difficile ATCC 9689 = DSM 1296]ARC16900.1 helix-turn-helix domain-containing protein [Clostridioides difficile]AVI14555.1 helix-turn-helix domain-containing protein [Clostridioides difficile]EGT4919207.1 helix-turn-helix domain-containing protein [Clostridioides difficile]EIJ0743487.1 helix-turn-helix domain-containing protein [Clostridioides difficile]